MQEYGMFTKKGNAAIDRVVTTARTKNLTWLQVLGRLAKLGTKPNYGEATDTAVREAVFYTLGFHKKAVDFYS